MKLVEAAKKNEQNGIFLLGNHGCCGVPGIKDHSKEGLQRSWWMGQGSLVDVIMNREGQLLLSHDADVCLTDEDAVLFEDAANWAKDEKPFICLNLLQGGDAGYDCAIRLCQIANAGGLSYAICSADGQLLLRLKKELNGTDTVYLGGCHEEMVKEAIKAKCSGIIIYCSEPELEEVEDLLKENNRRKRNKLVFMVHIESNFECVPWCVAAGIGFICDDPLEAVSEIMRYK